MKWRSIEKDPPKEDPLNMILVYGTIIYNPEKRKRVFPVIYEHECYYSAEYRCEIVPSHWMPFPSIESIADK